MQLVPMVQSMYYRTVPEAKSMQVKCDQRLPSLSMVNWPTKTEGISVRASRAKFRKTLPARFTAFSCITDDEGQSQ